MPVPTVLPPIAEFEKAIRPESNRQESTIFESAGLSALPKIYPEDRKVIDPQRYFKFSNSSRYSYLRLVGHGAYGYVW